jgi:hypothetical protein
MSKCDYKLKIMAFSALLWEKNISKERKQTMQILYNKEKSFIKKRFFRLWKQALLKQKDLAKKHQI